MHFLPVLGDSSVREEHWPGMRDVLVACFVYLFLGKRRAKLKLETPGGGAGLSCEIKCDKTGSWESFLLCKNCNFEIKSSLQQSSSHHHRSVRAKMVSFAAIGSFPEQVFNLWELVSFGLGIV